MYNTKTISNPTKSIRPTKRHCSHFSSTFPIQHPLQPCYKLGSSSHLQGEDTHHYVSSLGHGFRNHHLWNKLNRRECLIIWKERQKDLLCVSRNDSYDTFTFWPYYPNSGFTLNPSMVSSDTFVISNMWNGKILNCELLVCHASFLFCSYHVIFQFSRVTGVILKENSRVNIAWHFW